MTMISGWGRYPRVDGPLHRLRNPDDASALIAASTELIARGNGRSYGDPALNETAMLSTLPSDRLIAFDPVTGIITVEAGLTQAEMIDFILPRGWFPMVTPGTKFGTIGGLIAADAHGKNHHLAGTFGRHVLSFDLMLADGSIRHCTRESEPELFAATCGGMGLTGIILRATMQLLRVESTLVRQETLHAENFEAAMALYDASADWPYTVAWIDCLATGATLGRSVLYRSRHATASEAGPDPLRLKRRAERAVPIDFPSFALNHWSVKAFNEVYWRAAHDGDALVDIDPCFYPLDALHHWNRIYGPKGFAQYQCVIPLSESRRALGRLIERISNSGAGSFLAVLKRLGAEGEGYLSFPLDGYTLALDFPVSDANLRLMDELDHIVMDHGGRLYLAKDSRQRSDMLRAGYPRLDQFLAVRRAVDPGGKFNSLLSRRLGL